MKVQLLKREVKKHLPWILRLSPPTIAGHLIKGHPHWANLLPPGKVLKTRKYLGRFTVLVDAVYPIEREMLTGMYDETTVKVIDRFVYPGDVCFDVGANVGAITFALARATGGTGKVFAFEPGPPIFERLTANLALNPALREVVHTYQVGISDKSGALKWTEDVNNRGNGGLFDRKEGTEVPVVTLDDFCREHAVLRVNFIKVDVEGMELEVLRGAKSILRESHPILYYETRQPFIKFRGFNIFAEIEQLLGGLGYKLFKVDRHANIAETTSSDLSEDTLAMIQGPRSKRTGEGDFCSFALLS